MLSESWEIDTVLAPMKEAVREAVISYDEWINAQVDEQRLGDGLSPSDLI